MEPERGFDSLGYLHGRIEPRLGAAVLGNEAFDEASVSNQSDLDPGCRLPLSAREHTF